MIIMTHIIIFLGYNITKQEQVDIYVSKYMKNLHTIAKKSKERHRDLNINFIFDKMDDENQKGNQFFRRPPPGEIPLVELLDDKKLLNDELSIYDLEIAKINYKDLKQEAVLLGQSDGWELYEYKKLKYFYIQDAFTELLLKDNIKGFENTQYIIYLTILLNIVFVSFYLFLIKKLQPLQKLKNDIVLFSKGDLNIDTSRVGKDEISEVSNEFDKAIKEIKILTNSRNLFLRNIMHELKTPITKGLLISNMMEEGKFKNSLKKAFFRLEYLLNEFARIEEFTSKNIKIHKDEFRIIDIIDHSLDILLCDHDDIHLDVQDNIFVTVDFELFALALKNLLDNAIKYGKNKPTIVIKSKMISIQNIGVELSQPIQNYNKPFNKEYESSNNGLGLGLYIVNHILKAHELTLEYKFENGKNTFIIKFL